VRKECRVDGVPTVVEISHVPRVVPMSNGYRAHQVAASDAFLILYNMNSPTPRDEVEDLARFYTMLDEARAKPGTTSPTPHPVLFVRHNIPYCTHDDEPDSGKATDRGAIPYADQEDRALAHGLGVTVMEASALTSHNVEEAFHTLVRRLRSTERAR